MNVTLKTFKVPTADPKIIPLIWRLHTEAGHSEYV